MSQFENFEKVFGPPLECKKPAEAELLAFANQLPAELIEHWKDPGLCTYGGGLLRFTDPRQFAGILEEWLDPKPKAAHVFLRTAFADLYFWDEGFAYALDVQYGRVSQITDKIELFYDHALCDERVIERSLRRGLYQQAVGRLGPPAEDECYAFVPALALGGPGTAESLQKVKIREHLDILRQIVA